LIQHDKENDVITNDLNVTSSGKNWLMEEQTVLS